MLINKYNHIHDNLKSLSFAKFNKKLFDDCLFDKKKT